MTASFVDHPRTSLRDSLVIRAPETFALFAVSLAMENKLAAALTGALLLGQTALALRDAED